MPTYDFECLDCSHTERDLWFSWRNVPKMKRCPACGKKRSRQIFDEPRKAQIHLNNPALYGYYHPQMGCVIEDYGHKRRLMKENGMYEGSDPVRGNRKLSEESMHDDSQPEPDQSMIEWSDKADVETKIEEMQKKNQGNTNLNVLQ